MGIEMMHSILRGMFRKMPSYVAPTGEPEERLFRPQQYPVTKSWNVETIETYCLPERRKAPTDHVWTVPIPCLHPDNYTPYTVEFTHFFDGTQRTSRVREILWRKKGFSTVPVHIAQVSCIVLQRRRRDLHLCRDESQTRVLVEVPIDFLRDNARKDVSEVFENLSQHDSFEWVDTSYDTKQCEQTDTVARKVPRLQGRYRRIQDRQFKEALSDPNWLSNQSRKWTAKHRDALEQSVFDRLVQDYGKATSDGRHYTFFVKDGTLSSVRGRFVTSAVAVSKSFNTRFLPVPQQNRVVSLEGFHRTPAFRFQRDERGLEPDEVESEEAPLRSPQKHTVLSWYVRIRRPNRIIAPYWGLVRVEIHPNVLPGKGKADRWSEDDSRIVSAISAAIVSEASPTSHPDPRWHNLIYPICQCERYARSRMIPHETIKHIFMWGGASYE